MPCTMQYTLNTHIRFLLLITGGLTQCLALKHISVMRGDTLTLTCPIKSMKDAVEWRNPDGLIMFFNKDKVLKEKRNQFVALTKSKFSIQVTDITFRNGGVYKCLRYNKQASTKRYKVIVVGAPKLEKFEQEDKVIVKCSASANEHPPKLSWIMDNGLEIHPLPYYELKNASNKFTASSQLNVNIPKKRVTVKCVVRHPALYGSTVENFIHLGMQNEDTTTSSKHLTTTLGSTESTVIPTIFSSTSFTNSHSESKTTNDSKTTVNETTEDTSSNGRTSILSNNTTANETTETISETTEGTSANKTTEILSETTEGTQLNTSIESSSNNTGNENLHVDRQRKKGNSALLVMLVTCLIICLFVVLTFFLVRLRKAHVAWKKENEESDQSVESSKSKSSSEERQKQQQRGQGFWNTSFTKYKAEETPETETQTTSASVKVDNSQHFISGSGIKETEL
ncbi:cytotoxic and regulatory T-cell molecule [Silurus meridionalis]|uniref:cytotoxic and regulatory T-cell molecule n=1 Tax=Silurus meridionalis TaxID=175797 RepID=UPI001EEA1C7A|nr:cytotoxic and regulatory T-cell molecule [Silurus meridionalis]